MNRREFIGSVVAGSVGIVFPLSRGSSLSRAERILQLGEAMSEVSEKCWFAGWLISTESLLPEICRRAVAENRSQEWGIGKVTVKEAKRLRSMAQELGHWVDVSTKDGPDYMPYYKGVL